MQGGWWLIVCPFLIMLQARQHNEEPERVIFYEPFNSEQETRLKGGVPTDVDYLRGEGTFNGATSNIRKAISLNGTYSLRFKMNTTLIAGRYFCDFRDIAGNGTGWCLSNLGNLAPSTGTSYVNGQATTVLTANTDLEVVISGITILTSLLTIGARYNATQEHDGTFNLFEIHEGTLTAEQVANLY